MSVTALSGHKHGLLLLPLLLGETTRANIQQQYANVLEGVLTRLSLPSQNLPASVIDRPARLTVALPVPDLATSADLRLPRGTLYAQVQRLLAGVYALTARVATLLRLPDDPDDARSVDVRIVLVAGQTGLSPKAATANEKPHDGLVDHDILGEAEDRLSASQISPEAELQGPIIGVRTLARSGRDWNVVFAVDDSSENKILIDFMAAARLGSGSGLHGAGLSRHDDFEVIKLHQRPDGAQAELVSGRAPAQKPVMGNQNEETHQDRHWNVAVGGTFDHLHIGHKLLLTMVAFAVESAASAEASDDTDQFLAGLALERRRRRIVIGISGDALLSNKDYAGYLESWSERQSAVQDFLTSILDFSPPQERRSNSVSVASDSSKPPCHATTMHFPAGLDVVCAELSDPFGPTITDVNISALVVSAETAKGGEAVNKKRTEKGWDPLEIFQVDVLDANFKEEGEETSQDATERFQAKLSSTSIRKAKSEQASENSN